MKFAERDRPLKEAEAAGPSLPRPDASLGAAMAVVQTRGLSKAFGGRRALRPLTLRLDAGERLAVIGPNGAGKTTLIRLLATLTRPSRGSLEICGIDSLSNGQDVRSKLGVVLHETLLYSDLTVEENLSFFASLYHVAGRGQRIAALCARFELDALRDSRLRNLSRGQQQRTALVRALLHNPPLLLLDEPDTGLDARAFEQLSIELLADASRTVVFSTHHPGHALALATRILLLQSGHANDLGAASRWSADDLLHVIASAAGG